MWYTKSWLRLAIWWCMLTMAEKIIPNSDVFFYNKTKWWFAPNFWGNFFFIFVISLCIQICRTDVLLLNWGTLRFLFFCFFTHLQFSVFFLSFFLSLFYNELHNDDGPRQMKQLFLLSAVIGPPLTSQEVVLLIHATFCVLIDLYEVKGADRTDM